MSLLVRVIEQGACQMRPARIRGVSLPRGPRRGRVRAGVGASPRRPDKVRATDMKSALAVDTVH